MQFRIMLLCFFVTGIRLMYCFITDEVVDQERTLLQLFVRMMAFSLAGKCARNCIYGIVLITS
jgi:hypothetical protein